MKCIRQKCTYCIRFRTGMNGFYCGIGALNEDECNISRKIKYETQRWEGRIRNLTDAEELIRQLQNGNKDEQL